MEDNIIIGERIRKIREELILFGDNSSNNTISKINRILNKCSDSVLDYIYNLIRSTFYFVKNVK